MVVARFQEDVSWYPRIPPEWQLLEVQKGRELPNEGREASSYLWAILHLYDQLHPDDVVGFLQGDPFDHCPDIDVFLLLDQHPTTGFRPLGDNTYVSNGDGSPHHQGLPVAEKYQEWLGLPWPGAVHFCPGAQFVVTGADILRKPREYWQRLLNDMGDRNPWVIERLWASIFHVPRAHRATFYCQATPVTTYLRCELPARYLPGKVMRWAPVTHPDEESFEFPLHEGAAVFQFAGQWAEHLTIHGLQSKGVRVLMESDDNYFTVAPSMKNTGWVKNKDEGPYSLSGHASILKTVDGCIVTTEFLAKQYRKHNPNVYVAPNAIDPLDWPELEKPDDGVLRIGWFASDSHKEDIPIVYRALEWASRQKDVEVWVAGSDPFVSPTGQVRFAHGHLPWMDLPLYRQRLGLLDVGVAPVKATPWALCRSDLKAIEKAYAGAALVLSDVAPYDLFTAEENCLKARDATGFYKQIRRLVQNRDEVKQLAYAGREYVKNERLIGSQIHKWREALDG